MHRRNVACSGSLFLASLASKKIVKRGRPKKQTDGIEMQVLLFFQTFLLFSNVSSSFSFLLKGAEQKLIVAKSKRLTDTQCNLRLSI